MTAVRVDDLVDYLTWAFENLDAQTRSSTRVVVCRDRNVETTIHTLDAVGLATVADLIDSDLRGSCWYYRVHPIAHDWTRPVDDLGRANRGARGKKDATRVVTHLVADVDFVDPSHATTNLPSGVAEAIRLIDATIPPSAIAHSGGGLYPIWRLAEPFHVRHDADRAFLDVLFHRLHAHLAADHHVDKTMNGTEIVRPVGSVNRKRPKEPRPVRWERPPVDGDGDFTVAQLVARLDALDAEREIVTTPGAPPSSSMDGPTNPVAILYNARHTWDEILAADDRHLWVENPRRDGRPRSWRRRANLHDGNPETISLSADGESVIVRSSAVAATWGVKPGRRMDRFGLACRIARYEPREFLRATARDLENLTDDPAANR